MGWFNLKLFTLFVSICKKFYRFGKNDQINLSTQKCFPARTTQLISDPEYSDDPRIYSLTNLQSNGRSVSWHCKQTTGRISLQLFYTALHRTGKLIHRAQHIDETALGEMCEAVWCFFYLFFVYQFANALLSLSFIVGCSLLPFSLVKRQLKN